jgi:hypothetical protein
MADYWIKLYIEILDDSKMAVLPDRLWRRVIELFLMAGRFHQDGNLPDTRQLAWILRMSSDDLEGDLQQIASTGIIEKVVNGWFIPKFAKRQAASTSTERVNQFRKREQQKQYADETDLKRNVTQINRLTESDTDTDTDQIGVNSEISEAFSEASHILPYKLEDWNKAAQSLRGAGITPEEIKITCQKMDADEMTYTGLWSIEKMAMWVHAQHQAGKPINLQPKNDNGNGHKRKILDADGNEAWA